MTEISRKERERAERQQLIIEAAEKVIQKNGFDKATMDEIAQLAEVGKGTLYLYFENKTDLLIAICKKGSELLNSEMAAVLTQDIPGFKMVEKLGYVYLDFIQKNPIYFHAFNYYNGLIDKSILNSNETARECEENARKAMTYLVRALQIGMQDKNIDDSYNPKELGAIIWGATEGIVNMVFLKQKGLHGTMLNDVDIDLQSLVKNFIQVIGTGLIRKNDQ